MKEILKKRKLICLVLTLVAFLLTIIAHIGIVNEKISWYIDRISRLFISGAGVSLGLVLPLKNKEKSKQIEINENDERKKAINYRAAAMTLYLSCIVEIAYCYIFPNRCIEIILLIQILLIIFFTFYYNNKM